MTAEVVRAWAREQVAQTAHDAVCILEGHVGACLNADDYYRSADAMLAMLPELLADERVVQAAADHLTDESVRQRALALTERTPGLYGMAACSAALAETLAGERP